MPKDDVPILGRERDESDGDAAGASARRELPDITGDERFYRRLVNTISAMTASGLSAEETYRRAIDEAREDREFVELVTKTAAAVDEDAYGERWVLVQLLVDLENPAAADALAELVRTPIPEERSEDPSHGLSTVTEEVILRTTAMEGLARLQRQDVDTIETLLETIATSDYLPMRRAAWFAIVDGGQGAAIEKARRILQDRGDEWIADITRIPVEEAPQADRAQIGRAKPRPRRELPQPTDG